MNGGVGWDEGRALKVVGWCGVDGWEMFCLMCLGFQEAACSRLEGDLPMRVGARKRSLRY